MVQIRLQSTKRNLKQEKLNIYEYLNMWSAASELPKLQQELQSYHKSKILIEEDIIAQELQKKKKKTKEYCNDTISKRLKCENIRKVSVMT